MFVIAFFSMQHNLPVEFLFLEWFIMWCKIDGLWNTHSVSRSFFKKGNIFYKLRFRFYFVGDEDLLEIIGNSKSIPKLQKHFKKMFAGVTSILLNEEEQIISGISSKEGEEV